MRLIAIDASAAVPSVCVAVDGRTRLWRGGERMGPRPVLAAVRALLREAGLRIGDLDAIAFGRGPGAFTGVRLATGLAQGLGLGASLPVIPVSDLAALAWCAGRRLGAGRVLACIDARRGEVYWGGFAVSAGGAEPLCEEAVGAPEAAARTAAPDWRPAGTGVALMPGYGGGYAAAGLHPDARAVAVLAAGAVAVPAAAALPVYLRNRVAHASSDGHNQPVR